MEVTLQLLLVSPHTVVLVAGDVESMLGFSASRLVQGQVSVPALIHPDDQDVLDAMLRSQPQSAAQPQPQPHAWNLRMRQANGRIRCLVAQHDQEWTAAGAVLNLRLRDARSLFDPVNALAADPGFRSMMESTNDFIFFKDRHHVFTAASQTLVNVTQPSEHWTDLIGQTDYDVFPEEYADIYYRLEKQVFAGMTVAHEIQEFASSDGLKGWIDNRKFPIRNVQGEITGLFGIARVITDQVRAEQALRHERDSTRSILATVEAMIVALDTEGQITLVNRKGCQILGYAEDELVGQDWFATCLPHNIDVDAVRDVFKMSLAGDLAGSEYFENPVRTRSGEDRLIAWHNSTIRDRDGNIIGGLSAGEDITARKQTDIELRQSERKFSIAFRSCPIGASIASAEDGRFLEVNQNFERDFGWSRDDLLGKTSVEVGVWPDHATRLPWAQAIRALGRLVNYETLWVHKNGERRHVSLSAEIAELYGKDCILAYATDITARKQAEDYERFRSHTLELLNTNEPLTSLLETIVRGVEQLHPAMLCSILLLDGAGRHLVKGVAPSLPDFYNSAIEGIEIGIGVGCCGTAAFTGERVVASDITTHPYWTPYRALAARARLGACWSQPIRGANGAVLGTFAIYHRTAHTPAQGDISLIEQTANLTSIAIERKAAQEKLQLAAGVFTHALEGIMITTPDATIVDVNEAFTRITGYTRDEALGKNPSFLDSGRQGAGFFTAMWRQLLDHGSWYGESWNRRKNGEVFAEMQTISAVRDAQGEVCQYISLFSDITERKIHESQLEHIAHFDALTNLPNRLLLADRLQQAISQVQRRGKQLAVAYLDLDGFKAVNDRYGHESGDQMLISLAKRMKDALREGDTLARLGGDEFVAVLIDLDDTSASLPLLNRLLVAAALPVPAGDLSLQVSASLGVTFYPQDQGIEADQLLRQADQAMYQAKLAGKNRYHIFDAAHDSSLRVHHESLERIRLALLQREFVLYYQPKVNMLSGSVVGAEALIRWQHPERGLTAPAAFLPVIEDHPLAVDIGEWVIDTALTQMEVWHAAGLNLPVSVNVGARQLQQSNFFQRLQSILSHHPQVNPANLELEVLETSALADMAQVSQAIEDCTQIGVKFALDDFGTGYSSLTYLKRLRVTLLKIDQSFVRDMLDDPEDLAILQGVIGLAAAFKREVIAEGVETVAHGTALLQLGCELAQGYGIARPMPPEQLPDWVATWRPDAAWGGHKVW